MYLQGLLEMISVISTYKKYLNNKINKGRWVFLVKKSKFCKIEVFWVGDSESVYPQRIYLTRHAPRNNG